MNPKEAYQVLEIPPNSTPEEIKKQFKKLSGVYHPDVNKDPQAEEKFKKINQAYQVLTDKPKSGKFQRVENAPEVQRMRVVEFPPLQLFTTISFVESILGVSKEFTVKKQVECEPCKGMGGFTVHDPCEYCGGSGMRRVRQVEFFIMNFTCEACAGSGKKFEECEDCSGAGTKEEEKQLKVQIPGGIPNNATIKLPGAGHYQYNPLFGPNRQDAFITVKVEPDKELRLEGSDVHSECYITLLEALEGTTKKVKTVKGEQTITIPPKTKHRDKIKISKFGANVKGKTGDHVCHIEVKYPDNLENLIKVLKGN